MKYLFSGILLTALLFGNSTASAQDRGEDLFNQTCVACHTIGGGRLIGPDLANVHTRRDEAWIIRFVKTPQALANSGDADAVALLAEYNGLVMPDQALSDDDVRAVIGFIARTSPAAGVAEAAAVEEVSAADLAEERILLGRNLFVGITRLENGGAACNSCHSVDIDLVMTGGSLAINLTDAVPRLTRMGVNAMMAAPPFPVMRDAFKGKSVTEDERGAIVDFLQASAEPGLTVEPVDYGQQLLAYGIGVLIFLLGIFFILGLRGSNRSVNQSIYDRQISST